MDWIISRIHSFSCSMADAVSRKASTLTDTFKSTLAQYRRWAAARQVHGVYLWHTCCCGLLLATLPRLQLIQTLQESSGAGRHGQAPAELGGGSLGHFRLYFGLSHAGEWRWFAFEIGPGRNASARCAARLTVVRLLRRPWEHISNFGLWLPLLLPHRSFPTWPEQRFPMSGPRTTLRSFIEKHFRCEWSHLMRLFFFFFEFCFMSGHCNNLIVPI